jgi:hypothetical protein
MNVAWFSHTNFSRQQLSGTRDQQPHSYRGPSQSRFRAKSQTPALETLSRLLVWKAYYGDCASFRDLIEIGKQFDLIMVCAEYVSSE